MSNQMHLGGRGKSKGKFVPCKANKRPCGVKNTTHIDKDLNEVLKANFGEATKETYQQYLVNYLAGKTFVVPAKKKRGRTTKTTVARTTFPKNVVISFANQEELNNMLTEGSVRATTPRTKWNGTAHMPTEEIDNLYTVERVNEDISSFGVNTPFRSSTQADSNMETTLKELQTQNKKWALEETTLKKLTKVAITDTTSKKTTIKFQEALEVLEDCNFHSYNAYLTALWNINHEEKVY